jgi:hypothetical protein
MAHDYRSAYRRGMKILEKSKWGCDPEGMFHPPSVAKGQPIRLECERLATQLGMQLLNVCEEVVTAARIYHFIALCGTRAEEYFLSGRCPIDQKKIAKLSRRMPPFIRAKMKSLLAGSVNVVSNPDHAFDTDGWAELKRRLPKFRATLEYYAVDCTGRNPQLDVDESERLSKKLQAIQHECDLIGKKLHFVQQEEPGTPLYLPPASKLSSAPNWQVAYRRISLVYGVLQKTNRDLNSEFWKPEWVPTAAQLNGVVADVRGMALAAASINSWLHQ